MVATRNQFASRGQRVERSSFFIEGMCVIRIGGKILLRGWEFLYFDFLFRHIVLFNIELELQTSEGSELQNIQVDRAITSCSTTLNSVPREFNE